LAYAATKSIAQETAETFLKIQPRTFDLVVLMPSFVLGADPLVKNLGGLMVGSNGILMNHLLGQRMAPMIKTSIHIDDVAKLHVQALDLLIPAGRYLVSSGGLALLPSWRSVFLERLGKTL
jgi:nucleoside-diphosphate-sugar epimerase